MCNLSENTSDCALVSSSINQMLLKVFDLSMTNVINVKNLYVKNLRVL